MKPRLPPLARAMRPVQWSKNLFVLAPLVFAGGLAETQALVRSALAFAVFCAAASAVYLFNDLRDREADARHPLKRHRPLAAGTLSPAAAVVAAAVLAAASLGGAWWLGGRFSLLMLVYLVLNVLYTVSWKNVVILDVLVVSVCFVLRVLAGAAAIEVVVSRFLLLCSIFIALFLVIAKRRHEMTLLGEGEAVHQRNVLEHYTPGLLDQMINVVTASAIVCYALYAVAPETAEKYDTQLLVYTIPLVLFGVFRFLFLLYTKTDRRNPTEAMITDLPFVANLALWGLAVVWIVYGS